ncbi:hypothetical protein [Nocardioides pelophilus]|uniref:hypothetical protein n=1 Tax=Nocardioides pelophilus TaxID=2172019 RepID=UPI00160008C1|nr:hypothetical protein [Nocardioides pelophilus]
MTTQLKTLMDRAADLDFAAVDLDAITGAGDRTVRRRRVATGVAGLAAAAVVATGAVLLGGDDGDTKTDFSDDSFVTDVPMWTEGSVLHTPERTYDLGIDVLSFVRTSEGVVFTSQIGEETLGVYSFTGEGEPELIGETGDPHLRSDPDGPFAGWLDQSGDRAEAVVIDQESGERVWSAPARLEHSFPIVAIDSGSAYLADADEHPTHVVDLGSGEEDDLGSSGLGFVDAEGELTAYLLESPGGADLGLEIRGADGGPVEIRNDDGGYGVFSPGGRWISAAAEDVSVYDTATGESLDLGATGDREGFGYAWADVDTLMVLTDAGEADALDMLSCEIPSGDCTPIASFDLASGTVFAIPDSDILWSIARDEGSASEVEVEASAAEASSTERPE